MSNSPTSTSENWRIPSLTNIPRLEHDGSNWAIYAIRFRSAMRATNRWDYFNGSKPRPSVKDPQAPSKDEKEATELWEKEDEIARYLLQQRLPDSTVLGLNSCTSTAMCWKRVSDEYTAKSVYAQNDKEQEFLEMRCPKGGEVRPFLISVRNKREELAAAGIRTSSKDYQCTVLRGIPEDLAKFAAQLLGAARVSSSPLDTDALIDHICEEADRLKNRRGGGAQGNKGGGGKKEITDEALAATGRVAGVRFRTLVRT